MNAELWGRRPDRVNPNSRDAFAGFSMAKFVELILACNELNQHANLSTFDTKIRDALTDQMFMIEEVDTRCAHETVQAMLDWG